MALKLYNTLTQREEEIVPLEDGHVRMYTCGPTVYEVAHIGNLRTFVFQDLLRRYLLYKGFRLTHVMNITDVDDKIIQRAQQQGVAIGDYTSPFIDALQQDMNVLRIQKPEQMPLATDHIQEMIDLILALRQQGLTYEKDGSTYFRISSYRNYGRLSHLDLNQGEQAGHLEDDDYTKENPRDFALWKSRKPGETWWDSPMGPGRPGWHIECSAMSMKYLGESFDIHCGGVDLVFPHHENEIAQSEGATGKPFVKYWVHAAHLIVEGEKMAKSKGNVFSLADLLERGYSPMVIRYLLASVHYRKQLNFTFRGLDQARGAVQRVNDFLRKIREIPDSRTSGSDLAERIRGARNGFERGMDADLNISEALAALFELIKDVNPLLEQGTVTGQDRDQILGLFEGANQVLDVFQVESEELAEASILKLIEARTQARLDRDYARADEFRNQLAELGIALEDTQEGTRWKKVN